MSETIFTKIIQRQIPANIIYEDDRVIAFHDVTPQAPLHVLIVPKKVIPRIAEAGVGDEGLLGHLLLIAQQVATQLKVDQSGFRVVINNGPDAGESVPHLHVHLLAGRHLTWPPG